MWYFLFNFSQKASNILSLRRAHGICFCLCEKLHLGWAEQLVFVHSSKHQYVCGASINMFVGQRSACLWHDGCCTLPGEVTVLQGWQPVELQLSRAGTSLVQIASGMCDLFFFSATLSSHSELARNKENNQLVHLTVLCWSHHSSVI